MPTEEELRSRLSPLAYEVKFLGDQASLWDHGRCVERLRAEAAGLVRLGC